mmetsp:Transcript_4288/g.6636  ORF Transcript_4288/g.6636 Transcript_4288/m.6636 type:complete len:608 (-) Transcript_4288:117-1940(-)
MILHDKGSLLKDVILLLVIWFTFLPASKAEFPLTNGSNPNFQAIMFDESADFRQNVCHLHQQYDNGTTDLENVLQGLNISSVFECTKEYCNMKGDDLDPDNPGLFVVLLEELAKRAGFNWRDGYALVDPDKMGNKTFDELLAWSAESYDLAVSWWTETTKRIRTGIDFPEGWYEADIIMIGRSADESETEFRFNAFLKPFKGWLWFAIVVTIVVSGLIYYLLEVLDSRSDRRKLDKNPMENIFITGVAFTTHFEYHPRTNAAWLFALSVSFWAMIVGSAYTANLASFFVVQNTPGLQIQSLDDAVAFGYSICVWRGTGTDTILTGDFGSGSLIRKSNEEEVLQGVLNGECKVAALTRSSWDTRKHNYCELEWLGRMYRSVAAGFATRHDSGTKCTSLISEVIEIHFRDMIDEGFVKNAWEDHLKKISGASTCSAELELEESDIESQRLTFKSMAGIFICHAAISILVIAFTVVAKYTGKIQERNERLEKQEIEQLKKAALENRELRKTVASEIRKSNYQQEDTDSAILDVGGASSDDEFSVMGVQETIYALRSQMQRSQNQLSEEIRKTQHAQKQDISEIKDQLRSTQQQMKEQMASILLALNQVEC